MRSFVTIMLATLCLASGCASSSAVRQEKQERRLEAFLKQKNYVQAFDLLFLDDAFAGLGKNDEKLRAIAAGDPAFPAQIPGLIRERAAKADSLSRMTELRNIARFSGKDALIPAESTRGGLLRDIDQAVAEANRTGRIPVVLTDSITDFPSLMVPDADRIIFERSVDALRREGAPRGLVAAVFGRAAKGGADSAEYTLLQKALPELVLSIDDLKSYVAPVFPQYVAKIMEERTVTVRLIAEPQDRLLEEDVSTKIKRLSPYILLAQDQPATVTLTVARLQWDERRAPDRVETIMYSQGQVNFAAAVLLMPRNASYIYDVASGGIELSYAYEVKAAAKGHAPFNKLIRDKTARAWRSCSNARIQNVFGGVQPASFVANDHMQQICSGGGSPVGIDALRDDALEAIVRAIREVPAVSKVMSYR